MALKRILLLTTGGTLAAKDSGAGLIPNMAPDEILRFIPEIGHFCDVKALEILNIDSSNIQPEDWLLMMRTIRDYYDDFDGFVITHGTDTMAYTASALSYLIQNSLKPIVLTGSQKPIASKDSDARQNIFDAFWFCAHGENAGVYLMFDGKAIIGSRASKVKSKSMDAFESINHPIAALIHYPKAAIHLGREEGGEREGPLFFDDIRPGVFLLKLIPGIEPNILEYVGQYYDAIVIESYGMGGVPFADRRNFLEQVRRLASKGKILAIATQVKSEGSDLSVYEVGMKALQSVPLLQSMDMTIEAVVTKLMWILAKTKDFKEVEKLFYMPVNNDISLFPGTLLS
ncbi:MAG: asparaginase [Treponema sp.]|nr:asparaginase [Treponema sp.]